MTTTTASRAAEAVRALIAGLDAVALEEALATYAAIDGVVEAARSRRVALLMTAAEQAGQDPQKVATSAVGREGRTSRRDAQASAKRAAAVRANDELGDRLAAGELTAGQLDNIAHALDTDPSAATDTDLIDKIAERSVDQGRRVANDWATEKTSAKELERKHQRERRNRCVQTYWSADRNAKALTLYGDGPTIDRLWRRINAEERVEYRNDGGRDVRLLDHPRTRDQRRFDAAIALFDGTAAPTGGRAATVISIPWHKIAGDADGADKLSRGDDGDTCAELVGYGPIPDSVALEALAASELFVNLTGLRGQTLWWGRAKRHADRDQFIALVIRDKGCVLCGSDWQHCEAHHRIPWEATRRGPTDIDNLALVCSPCHHRLHDNYLTLYQDPNSQQWLTRPAKPDEIAPKRPKATKRSTRERASPDCDPTKRRSEPPQQGLLRTPASDP